MIDLHYVRTSNGLKIAIMLEEIELDYRIIEYDIFAGDHLKPQFKAINPNHKLPAIVDHAPEDGEGAMPIFETGAILLYLAEKSGRLIPSAPRRRMEALQWLAWQISGLGPMLGQGYHFARYAPEGQDYGIARYTREARRLLGVLNYRLSDQPFLAGEYSIADIACWPWLQNVGNLDIDRAEFPAIQRWWDGIAARPAVQRVVRSSTTEVPTAYVQRRMSLTPAQWSNLFGDKLLDAVASPDP
ncbi:glutathione binding-like protein [Rhizorhabdus histidinilytica]|uniref:GST-like protein n=1 Tax=Rhizorhabdus histidinilytica TaxID=439228 RepID=A0A1T5GUE5_9SPHN|nr:glutathione binding-like protein [Rhizorhabdus histidinilytica]SKC11989.1 GST-like protein [Rhizorhabdus histidinilytica]